MKGGNFQQYLELECGYQANEEISSQLLHSSHMTAAEMFDMLLTILAMQQWCHSDKTE